MVRYSLNFLRHKKKRSRFKSDSRSSPGREHSFWWLGALWYPWPDLAVREWNLSAYAATDRGGLGGSAPRAPHQQSVQRRHLFRARRRILSDPNRGAAGDVASAADQLRRQNVGHDIVL